LRIDAIFNTKILLANAADKNTKYYYNSLDDKSAYYNPETGETFINLAQTEDNQSLAYTTLHETGHKENNLDKVTEERVVDNYANNALDLMNFYHNTGTYKDGINSGSIESGASSLMSWAYGNSSVADQYNLSSSYLNNLYVNSTSNLTQASLVANNFAASMADPNKIETYQKDVHKYLTQYLGENAGFTHEEARQIAAGNYRVDTRWNTQPLTLDTTMQLLLFQGTPKADYHFTSPERLEDMRQVAYQTENLQLFGQYLHAFQDSFSHQKDGVPYDSGKGHLNILEDEMGAHVDRTYNRPELADQMAKATYVEMQKFLEYRNRPTLDNMNSIYPKIQFFNRVVIEDNNVKGKILFK